MIAWLFVFAAPLTAQLPSCVLSAEDKAANGRLTFDDFDQKGTGTKTARKLSERGCWMDAAQATADYLIRGPIPSPGEQRVLLFHLSQQLAFAGEERRAADFIAATRRPDQPFPPMAIDLHWNEYVTGTWAFLTKNRPMLIAARDAVLAGTSAGDRINGNLLAAMERCFDESYAVAYDAKCGANK